MVIVTGSEALSELYPPGLDFEGTQRGAQGFFGYSLSNRFLQQIAGGEGKGFEAGNQLGFAACAAAFMEADDETIAVLSLLYGVDNDVCILGEHAETVSTGVFDNAHRQVQVHGFFDGVSVCHAAGMGQKRIGERMMAHIRLGIRVFACRFRERCGRICSR